VACSRSTPIHFSVFMSTARARRPTCARWIQYNTSSLFCT
jgi:hypothetical protein